MGSVMLMTVVLLASCQLGGLEVAALEDGEWLPGGETTNTLMLGSNAFIMPAANLDAETERAFYSGNSFFNQAWVEAPASTKSRDGLGPLFNASSCSGCHFKDGRGKPPIDADDTALGLLVRLALPSGHEDPIYGGQLQDFSNRPILAEGQVEITWEDVPGSYPDGTTYTLRRPLLSVVELGYGPMSEDTAMGLRVAPQVIGLGLLEALDNSHLVDPDDEDGDGISGRMNMAPDLVTGEVQQGRFGWKAEQTSVMNQSAAAFAGDMGLTSWIQEGDDCTSSQDGCLSAENGGFPEIEELIMERVGVYSATVAVPVRRSWEDETVLRGKLLFARASCTGCHVPSYTTGDHPIEALAGQKIWPYTDLLLHDMGEDLADGLTVREASGSEWRPPPLWGLGLLPDVNGHQNLLHDGRARGLEEAILWHGGEAQASLDAFMALDALDRDAVIEFLESL